MYNVENESEVGVIFEVLNDRGKPLSRLDIVKNFLIYETERISGDNNACRQLTQRINYGWKEILENLSVADMTDNEAENNFLRMNYVLNFYSEISKIKEKDGKTISINSQLADTHKLVKSRFKQIEKKDRNKCYKDLESYVESLVRMSSRLRDLRNPFEKITFQEIPEGSKQQVQSLAAQFLRLKTQSSVLPVLTAIYEVFFKEAENLVELMKLCEIAVFRIYYIAGRPSYAGRDKFFALANNIYRNRTNFEHAVKNIKEIIEEYSSRDTLKKKLLDKEDFYQWDGLPYFLYELERKRCKESGIDKKPNFEWDQMKKWKREDQIEHILPQKIDEKRKVPYWTERFDTVEHKKYSKKLGNMTLSYSNQDLGNKGFDKKQPFYKESLWQITKDVAANFTDWTKEAIEKRERELITFAEHRWSTS